MKRRVVAIASMLVFILAAVSLAMDISGADKAHAASTRKMTVYEQVIVKGSTAYAVAMQSLDDEVYKVNLRTGKKKILLRHVFCGFGYKLHGNYLYYVSRSYGYDTGRLYRINVNTGKKKKLARVSFSKKGAPLYVIKGKKIYYKEPYKKTSSAGRIKKMNLNGSGKRRAGNARIKVKTKNSNKKRYKLLEVGADYYYNEEAGEYLPDHHDYYLRTPGGRRIFVCKNKAY